MAFAASLGSNLAWVDKLGLHGQLFLTFRTPEGRPAVLRETLHDAAAARCLAGLALAVVDLERMLEIAELARRLTVVAQAGAAGPDGVIQHGVDCIDQSLRMIRRLTFLGRQRRGDPARRQMRAVQRFADIDVAEPRDHTLVEQRRLQARGLAFAG